MAKATVDSAKRETKTSNSSTSSLHPPYLEMICEAISTLKDRTGSSQPAIAKFIEDKYNKMLPPNFKKLLSVQLKKFVNSEKLVKVKNSYKISSTEKLKLAIKETQNKKGTAKNNSSTPKENAAKKVSKKSVKTKRLSQVKTPEGLKRQNLKSENKARVAMKTRK
ncbi:histone H1-like [Durio zibethinus]|uniref:Histone H1-like n=1 Tax=Durio zibethinus TaxID=66656 RepID=A0A6P6A4N4_DURZI|nr:histone H1-like [Durio zibethinus]